MWAKVSPIRLRADFSGGDTLTAGLQSYLFTAASGEQRLVVWSADDKLCSLELLCNHVVDMMARAAPIQSEASASVRRLKVGAEPVDLSRPWQIADLQPKNWRLQVA